jgi:hypothetical protein
VPDIATGTTLHRQGFDFICYSGDVWLLAAAIKAGVDGIRAGAGGGRQARSAPDEPVK